MEKRLNDAEESTNPDSPSKPFLEKPEDKDQLIRDLETEVEQQRQLRLADAKQVEAKAARIKDWVTNKLRELEEQNQHLRAQNAHCTDQMNMLKSRLDQIQAMNATTKSSRQNSLAEVSLWGMFHFLQWHAIPCSISK